MESTTQECSNLISTFSLPANLFMRLLLQDGLGQIQVLHRLMAHPVASPMAGPKVRPRGIASSAAPNTMPTPAPNTSP